MILSRKERRGRGEAPVRGRLRRLRPCGRAVYRAPIRKWHNIRQLALRRKVAGDVFVVGCESSQFLAHVLMRVEYKRSQADFVAYETKRCGEIDIAADNHEGVRRLSICIGHHLCCKIDIGTLLNRSVNDSIRHFAATLTGFFSEWKFDTESLVETLYDFHYGKRAESFKIPILVECRLRFCGIVFNSSREILYRRYIVFFGTGQQGCGKSNEIEPLIPWFSQKPVLQIESINIEDCFFLFHAHSFSPTKRQGPDRSLAPHRIAVAQRVVNNPSRGSPYIVSNPGRGCKRQLWKLS